MSFAHLGRTPSRAALALLALAAFFVPVAQADWPHDPFVGNVPVCTYAGNQDGVAQAPDGSGGVILAWYDYRAGTTAAVYAQRISADGTPLWTSGGVALCGNPSNQLHPAIVSDGVGGAIVVWEDGRNGAYDLYAQRVDANGAQQWAAAGVPICQAPVGQFEPYALPDGAGGAIIAWRDNRIPGNADIFAQRVNASGVVQWATNGVGICNSLGSLGISRPVSDGAGGFFMAWEDYRSGNADVYVQRVNASGVPQWTTDGVAVCIAADTQGSPRAVADGQGGVVVTWYDWRTAGYAGSDIYAQRLSGNGAALWPANGVAISTASGSQTYPLLAADGSGGAIIAWWDQRAGVETDVYAQRVAANGAGMWTMNGVALGTGAGSQVPRAMIEDGLGGALVFWDDNRSGLATDIYAQRVDRNGSARWTANGVAVCAAVGAQTAPSLGTDGTGTVIAAWADFRNGGTSDIYAQRVDRYGQLGNAEPRIASLGDVLNDQGGALRLAFAASYLDEEGFDPDLEYTVWRSIPAAHLLALKSARGTTADPERALASGQLLVLDNATSGYAWELVAEVPAYGLPSYTFVVPTTGDSVQGSNPLTAVMVMVHDRAAGTAYWASAPDSAYSVDNLPPAAPAAFTASRENGATELAWAPNEETDLAEYRLYRGTRASFEPSPDNLVSTQTANGYSDPTVAPFYYKLFAVDVHGNVSPVSLASTPGTTGVGGFEAAGLSFAPPAPNPARAAAMLRWSLPQASHTRLEVFDAAGRRVRTLVDGPLPAGAHSMRFELAGESGSALPSGMYLLRLETAGRVLTRRMMAVR